MDKNILLNELKSDVEKIRVAMKKSLEIEDAKTYRDNLINFERLHYLMKNIEMN